MVVDQAAGGDVDEEVSEAHGFGQAPDLIHDRTRVGHRHLVFGEAGAGGADHVEQDAILRTVVGMVQIAGPVLRAQAVGIFLSSRFAVVFQIEQDQIDAQVAGFDGVDL